MKKLPQRIIATIAVAGLSDLFFGALLLWDRSCPGDADFNPALARCYDFTTYPGAWKAGLWLIVPATLLYWLGVWAWPMLRQLGARAYQWTTRDA